MHGISYFFNYFSHSLRKLTYSNLGDLSEMTSYRSNEYETVLLFSHLLIVASLFIVSSCKKMATQRPDRA